MKLKLVLFIGLIFNIAFGNALMAQGSSGSKYGADSVNCVMNNSLYYEFYKQWKASNYKNESWKDAVNPWRWVLLNCPASTINIYLHGENLVEELIKNETDKTIKESFIDTLMLEKISLMAF